MPDAARTTDPHVCPLPAHPGGPVTNGSPMIEITSLAAARLVDRTLCLGPDPIAQGSSTVLFDGLPAARKTDHSSHGGSIIGGEASVLVGGPPITIRVTGDEAFMVSVQTALAKLLKTRSGLVWMQQMAANGRMVTIKRVDENNATTAPDDYDDAKNGTGTDSTISWNPNMDQVPGFEDRPGSEVILAHEMVHALHDANGKNSNGPNDQFPPSYTTHARSEERSTVGTGGPVRQPDGTFQSNPPDYSNDVPTEN